MGRISNIENYSEQKIFSPGPKENDEIIVKPATLDSAGETRVDLARIAQKEITNNKIIKSVIAENFSLCKMLLEIKKSDKVTFEHVLKVTENVIRLIEASGEQIDSAKNCTLIFASLVHDIGKTDNEINKVVKVAGKLNKKQCAIMKKHSRKTFDRLKNINHILAAKIAVRHHELGEDEDGLERAYPRSKNNDYDGPERRQADPQVEEMARILAISDVFDALISERPYKKAMSIAQCEEVLREKFREEQDQKNITILVDAYKNKKDN